MRITKCIQTHSFQTSTVTPIFYCSYRCVYYLCINNNFFKEICRKKTLGKADNSQQMFTPWRAIFVNNTAKNTKVLSFFSQNLLKVFPKKNAIKRLLSARKCGKTSKKVCYKLTHNSGNNTVTPTFYWIFGCITVFSTTYEKLEEFCRKSTMVSNLLNRHLRKSC